MKSLVLIYYLNALIKYDANMGWCIFDKDTRQPMKRKQYNLGGKSMDFGTSQPGLTFSCAFCW